MLHAVPLCFAYQITDSIKPAKTHVKSGEDVVNNLLELCNDSTGFLNTVIVNQNKKTFFDVVSESEINVKIWGSTRNKLGN